ncbi:hypothetical protein C2E20_8160 [Micractinium conductrix]|uniref:Uncharacterized protein n=1 Tax=Micractinium conductrix TaxID=554055 RepID=A0A2P6V296_9CHLO|nr:hypothetical protein C2E20_8160 [Micractinium conductrix]|eukprot:PSC68213.1 hypothetical protein C2E20_8160 [Micractinium conductrix]
MDAVLFNELGALPELDYCSSQKWQSCTSFCELDMAAAGAASWVGCDVLLQEDEEECSSQLLSQCSFDLSQPMTTIAQDHPAFPAPLSPESTLHRRASQAPSPTTSLDTTMESLESAAACADAATSTPMHAHVNPVHPARSPSPACTDAVAFAAAMAASPALRADMADVEAVRIAALALQMSQGDGNAAIAQLLSWASAQ